MANPDVKKDCKALVLKAFGEAAAAKVDDFPEDPKLCIEKTEEVFSILMGAGNAKKTLRPLREKFKVD